MFHHYDWFLQALNNRSCAHGGLIHVLEILIWCNLDLTDRHFYKNKRHNDKRMNSLLEI